MKRVMVFGTFDLFHEGHRNFFKQTRKFGSYLLVVVARDKTVARYKKQGTKNKEQKRADKIKKSKLADKVILGSLGDKYQVIKKYKPDIICLGYDQNYFVDKLDRKLKEFGLTKTKIIRLKPYKADVYKSSKIKSKLFNKKRSSSL